MILLLIITCKGTKKRQDLIYVATESQAIVKKRSRKKNVYIATSLHVNVVWELKSTTAAKEQ